jgi:putative transposase
VACTNFIENMMGTVRRVCRNVKRWQDAAMARLDQRSYVG